jgi:hypothetical protein
MPDLNWKTTGKDISGHPIFEDEEGFVRMTLIPSDAKEQLLKNGEIWFKSDDDDKADRITPVVRLFMLGGLGEWLIFAMHPRDHDKVAVLGDMQLGHYEYGVMSLSDKHMGFESMRGVAGCPIERDICWKAQGTVKYYLLGDDDDDE